MYVESAQFVLTNIKWCRQYSIDFVVCGEIEKHSSSDASSIEGGLVIDLSSKLRDTKVDTDTKTVRVQGRCI